MWYVADRLKMGRPPKPTPQYWQKGHLSLSGGGFLGSYHIGVVLAFKEYAPHIASRKVLGASAGTLAAMCLVDGVPIYEGIDIVSRVAVHARSLFLGPLSPRLEVGAMMRDFLDKSLPPDVHRVCSGRAYISTTRLATLRNEMFNEFESRDELLNAVMASCYIPYFIGLSPPIIRGARYVDGGFTDNQPTLDENTITVSVFGGLGCIRPAKTCCVLPDTVVTPNNLARAIRTLCSPPPSELAELLEEGYKNACRFIRKENLYACGDCARLDGPPTRGDCAACNALFVRMMNAQVDPKYLQPFRRAQLAENELTRLNPSQHTPLVYSIRLLRFMAVLPFDVATAVAYKAFGCCDKSISAYWPGWRNAPVEEPVSESNNRKITTDNSTQTGEKPVSTIEHPSNSEIPWTA